VGEFFETITDVWESMTVELKELIDIYEFRDRLVIRVEGFDDKAEAFKAAGLTE
jgi:hypothetical protein